MKKYFFLYVFTFFLVPYLLEIQNLFEKDSKALPSVVVNFIKHLGTPRLETMNIVRIFENIFAPLSSPRHISSCHYYKHQLAIIPKISSPEN